MPLKRPLANRFVRHFAPAPLILLAIAVWTSSRSDAVSGVPITRANAISTVTTILISGSPYELSMRAYASQTTLPAGTPLGETPSGVLATVSAESWFVWLDLAPAAGFGHPTRFVLVDATTGAITLNQLAEFWPYVGGLPLYESQTERDTSLDMFWDGAPVPAPGAAIDGSAIDDDATHDDTAPDGTIRPDQRHGRVDRLIDRLGPQSPRALAGTWGAIICPYDTSTNQDLAVALREMKEAFDSLGITTTVSNKTSRAGTLADISALPDSCTKLYVAWMGHGAKNDSLATGDGGRIGHKELACSLAAQAATEYCVIVDACYSGAILDDLTAKGVNGSHMVSTPDSLIGLRHIPSTRWKGDFGWWFTHFVKDCIVSGQTGAQLFAWVDSSVCAYKDSIRTNGSACADSAAWAPYIGGNIAKPVGSITTSFTDVGPASTGVPFAFEIGAGCSTGCILFPGSTDSDTCANFTLSCEVGTGWQNVGSFNWNKGKPVYFRTFGTPGATGKYKMSVHSNKPAGPVQITWLRDTATDVTSPSYIYNAAAVGWTDASSQEFSQSLGAGTNGIHGYQWADGTPHDQVPAFTGPNWFVQVQTQFPLEPDFTRLDLYNGADPLSGYKDDTILVLQPVSLQDPFGGPGFFTNVQVRVFQFESGYFSQYDFPVKGFDARGPGFPAISLNLGTLFPEPLSVEIEVFGPDVIEWDLIGLMPGLGFDPTGSPQIEPTPGRTRLLAARPNPFRSETSILFELARTQDVRLQLYDVSGRLVRTLVSDRLGAGSHAFSWNGRTETGIRASSGVYFYRLETDKGQDTKKVVFLR